MSEVRKVSAEEGKKLVDEGYTYLDVRTEEEYAAGHAAGAVNVPFMLSGGGRMMPNPEFSTVMHAAFASDAKLLVACQAGARSAKAVAVLVAEGFTDLIDLRPGYGGAKNPFGQITEKGWQGAGLPTETATPGGSYAEIKQRSR
jgi:rhodanese-related sulfurtransferase